MNLRKKTVIFMKLSGYENNEYIMQIIGRRIQERRVSMNITQKEFAVRCGVSSSTLERIERGEDTKISNLLMVLRGLDLNANIDMLIPDIEPDYKAMYEMKKIRKRASSKRKLNNASWVWEEDK